MKPAKKTPKFSEIEIIKTYMESIQESIHSEPDLDKNKLKFQELMTLAKTLKSMEESEMPIPVQEVEKDDAIVDDMYRQEEAKSTVKAKKEVKEALDSSSSKLSMAQAVDAPVTDSKSGGTNDMDIVHQLDKETTDASEKGVVEAKNRKDIPLVTDTDVEMHDSNTDSKIMLGADANADKLEQPSSHSSTVSTSANAMHISIAPMEVETDQATLNAIKDAKMAEKEQALKEKRIEMEESKMDTKKSISETLGELSAKADIQREQHAKGERAHTLSLMEAGGDIEGFDTLMGRLAGQQIIDDPEDIKVRRRILSILRHDSKLLSIQTAKVPSSEDLFKETILGESGDIGSGKLGGSGIGTPVFVPGMARDNLFRLQKGALTLTETEAVQLREEMTPLWNEFKLGRLAAGVREMERMPTRLLTSDTSNIKAASKIRGDVDQQEESFFYFMYWLLHDRLDSTKASTWRGFLSYSAAMGYGDLTQSQINWLITGNPNGDLTTTTDFSNVSEEEGDPLDVEIDIRGMRLTKHTIESLSSQVMGNPEPQVQYPSRNTSPSAAPVDNSIHPDGTSGVDRANQMQLSGIPSRVSNIPDPRFSKRGGVDVPNVRIITVKNPKYDPTKKEGDEGYEKEWITQEAPDIGAGSKDIGAQIEMAESDRLLRSIPTKLYPPIHAQACDRYLGALNYQRLSLPIEQYMKSYSQHPWGPSDFQQMYNWNSFTMGLYGEMLYAFVTDIQMQRTSPVFNMDTPESVGDEYMELNELISELARFQQHADDRADRVNDSGAGQRPLEDHMNKFYEDRNEIDKQNMMDSDAVVISTEGLLPIPTGSGGEIPTPTPAPDPTPAPTPHTNPWGPGPDPTIDPSKPWSPENDRRKDISKPLNPNDPVDPNDTLKPHIPKFYSKSSSIGIVKPDVKIGAVEMDQGIRRTNGGSERRLNSADNSNGDDVISKRNHMYKMFQGR